MDSVLVTGGAGYIGGHVCKAIRFAGFQPVVIDNLSTGFEKNVKWGPLHKVDLRDFKSSLAELKAYTFVAAVHLAASAYVEESQKMPLKYYENNLLSTINILRLLEALQINYLVFSSSCAVYGETTMGKLNESSALNPINHYGRTKKMCEEIITSISNSQGFKYITLRFFNACGADLTGELQEEHNPETHVIPRLIESGLNRSTFNVYGSDYPTLDGTAVRDYLHVSDLAMAHVESVRYLMAGGVSQVLNIGSGKGRSILDLIKSAKKIGLDIEVNFLPRREGDPAELVADISRAGEVLEWKPKINSLEEILSSTHYSREKNKFL